MADAFDAIGINYERQAKIGRWSVDFLLRESRIVVECDGDYWHSRPEVVARDIRKNADLEERGYAVIRLNESEIRASPEALARDVARQHQEATATASGVDESGERPVPVAA
jgi:very-short-patch-repair endonuclease